MDPEELDGYIDELMQDENPIFTRFNKQLSEARKSNNFNEGGALKELVMHYAVLVNHVIDNYDLNPADPAVLDRFLDDIQVEGNEPEEVTYTKLLFKSILTSPEQWLEFIHQHQDLLDNRDLNNIKKELDDSVRQEIPSMLGDLKQSLKQKGLSFLNQENNQDTMGIPEESKEYEAEQLSQQTIDSLLKNMKEYIEVIDNEVKSRYKKANDHRWTKKEGTLRAYVINSRDTKTKVEDLVKNTLNNQNLNQDQRIENFNEGLEKIKPRLLKYFPAKTKSLFQRIKEIFFPKPKIMDTRFFFKKTKKTLNELQESENQDYRPPKPK